VFAETLGLASYGVCSLDAIGAASDDEPELVVVTPARRAEVYWARYRRGVRTSGPDVAKPIDVPIVGATALAGAASSSLDAGLPIRDVPYPPSARLTALAADRVLSKAPSEVLLPLYLRRPDAVANPSVKPVSQ
jgi:tRNA A37 threonylcarbamoyladenosine modification protein TsaB